MGNHIDSQGRFKSDKYPDLEPDKLLLSFNDPLTRRALRTLVVDYWEVDPDFARDIQERLQTIDSGPAQPKEG